MTEINPSSLPNLLSFEHSDPIKTIVVVAGYWSTNIGNSFFQLGAEYLLKQAYPQHNVIVLSDQPGYWQTGAKGNPPNALILLEYLNFDYLVLQGPFLRSEYDRIWLPTLRKLQARGVKVIALASGMMDYGPEMVATCRKWLAETPPFILTTRDRATYDNFHDLAEHSLDAIDIAFFVSDFFHPPAINLAPFVAFNFDKWPEPQFSLHTGPVPAASPGEYAFAFGEQDWRAVFPRRLTVTRKSRLLQFLDSWIPQSYASHVAGYPIIRTDHRFNPSVLRRMFRGPNAFVSDIPQSYLTIYANAVLTLSNRVHACVATLAYGNQAMLFSGTPRSRLLERAGAIGITQHPVSISATYLREEKQRQLDFLRSIKL